MLFTRIPLSIQAQPMKTWDWVKSISIQYLGLSTCFSRYIFIFGSVIWWLVADIYIATLVNGAQAWKILEIFIVFFIFYLQLLRSQQSVFIVYSLHCRLKFTYSVSSFFWSINFCRPTIRADPPLMSMKKARAGQRKSI